MWIKICSCKLDIFTWLAFLTCKREFPIAKTKWNILPLCLTIFGRVCVFIAAFCYSYKSGGELEHLLLVAHKGVFCKILQADLVFGVKQRLSPVANTSHLQGLWGCKELLRYFRVCRTICPWEIEHCLLFKPGWLHTIIIGETQK